MRIWFEGIDCSMDTCRCSYQIDTKSRSNLRVYRIEEARLGPKRGLLGTKTRSYSRRSDVSSRRFVLQRPFYDVSATYISSTERTRDEYWTLLVRRYVPDTYIQWLLHTISSTIRARDVYSTSPSYLKSRRRYVFIGLL